MKWFFFSFFLLVSLIHCMGFPGSTSGKEHAWQCRQHKRCWFEPWVRRSPGGGHSNPLQYSYLENPTDRETWQATVPWVTKSWTQPKWLSMPTCSPLHSTVGRHEMWSHSATAPPISWTTGGCSYSFTKHRNRQDGYWWTGAERQSARVICGKLHGGNGSRCLKAGSR